jgi:hypothetical protein
MPALLVWRGFEGRKRSVLLGKGAGSLAGGTFFRLTAAFFFKSAFFAFPNSHPSLLSDNILIYNQFGYDFIQKEISVKKKGQAALSQSARPFLPVVTSVRALPPGQDQAPLAIMRRNMSTTRLE